MSKALDSLNQMFDEFEQSWQGDDTRHRLDLAEIIWRGLNRTGWTQRRFAKECGLADADVSLLIHGEKNFTSSTLGKVVNALKIKVKLQEAVYEPQKGTEITFFGHPSGDKFSMKSEDQTDGEETKINVNTSSAQSDSSFVASGYAAHR